MPFDPTFEIPAHTKRQFHDAFEAAIQQNDSRLAGVTNIDPSWTSKQYVKRMRETNAWRVNNTRFGKTNAKEFKAGFRSGFRQQLEAEPIKFDRADKALLDSIPLPTGPVLEDMMSGLNRIRDDLFVTAASAASLGGADPYVTPTAFPVSQVVPVNYIKPGAALGANKGLTVWKLLEARNRFLKTYVDVDREDIILAISSDEETQLMLDAEAANNDAWAAIVLKWFEARLSGNKDAKLMGIFRVVTTNSLTVSALDIRTCVAFAKRAFCASPMSGMETHIDVLSAERHSIQVAAYADWGCFRVFDEMVLEMPCDISP